MSFLGIKRDDVGGTYTSKGVVFVVLAYLQVEFGEVEAEVLVLDDNPTFTVRIKPGTVMQVGEWSDFWKQSMRIASPGEQGKVSS